MLAVGVLTLSACASAPSREDIANADYGREITQSECEQIVKNSARTFLKDPSSAEYDFGQCYKSWVANPPILGGGANFGYLMQANINAKNSFGGYTGATNYKFLIKNGIIIKHSSCIIHRIHFKK